MNKFKYITTLGCIAVGVPLTLVASLTFAGVYATLKREPAADTIITESIKVQVQPVTAQAILKTDTIKPISTPVTAQANFEPKIVSLPIKQKEAFQIKSDTTSNDSLIEDYADTTELLHD